MLIIPNVLDMTRSEGDPISEEELATGLYASRRWLWLMRPGDAIILPDTPPPAFLRYLEQFGLKELSIVVAGGPIVTETLKDPSLLAKLKKIVKSSWKIDPFSYTPAIIDLAEALGLFLPAKWKKLVRNNFCHKLNCKSYFRQLGQKLNIPMANGLICHSAKELACAIEKFLPETGQVMVKEDYNGGGAGNTGLSKDPKAVFTGASKRFVLGDIEEMAHKLWTSSPLIVEVYHPNQGVFTCDTYIPQEGEIKVVNYAEMRMEGNWIGGEIPASGLQAIDRLISPTLKLGKFLQKEGYFGYMCSDAVLNYDHQLIFTEINVRQSGFLHADTLARRLFGDDYMQKTTLLIRKDVEIGSFEKARALLDKAGLLFKEKSGVIFLTVYGTQAEFLSLAPTAKEAHELESKLLKEKF